jgi:PHD/YefM family antitoxin component YafN of YafNO toxin-antitoxin module
MKVVTLQQFEADFDAILEDVEANKEFYRVQSEAGDVMLIPYDDYVVLRETYQEWVDHPQIDPFPLPVEYIADAKPEKI